MNSVLKILLIEDNEHDRIAFRRTLKKSNMFCELTEFDNAEDALSVLKNLKKKFDLILVDYNLPCMDGLEFCKQVIQSNINIPLIIITGGTSEEIAANAIKSGVHEYLLKDTMNNYLDKLLVVAPKIIAQNKKRIDMLQNDEFTRINEKKFRSLYRKTPVMMHSIDRDIQIIEVSDYWLKVMGYNRDEVIGKKLTEFLTNDSKKFAEEVALPEFFRKGYSNDTLYQFVKKNGSMIDVLISATAETDANGYFEFSLAVCIDVTEKLRSEKELIESKLMAEKANQAKTLFLANMSHELRTPLTGIIGMCELISDSSLTEEQNDYLTNIRNCADGLLCIVNDMLDFSKIDAGKLEIKIIRFNLWELLQETISFFIMQADEKSLNVASQIDVDVPQIVFGDPVRLRQILVNIIGNAIKFTEKGQIEIHVRLNHQNNSEASVSFSVSDTGIGIPPEKILGLFKAFSQVDSSLTRRYGGTGLGLAISKRLCDEMNGSIGVSSELGKGSTFWFLIPFRLKSKTEPYTIVDQSIEVESKSGIRILVVDDNQLNRQVIMNYLKKMGYASDVASDGKEAIEAIKRNYYDIVLMDIQMPEMNGLEVTQAIRSSSNIPNPNIIIIAITAHAFEKDRSRCLEAGMNDYLAKPVDYNTLKAKLNEHVSKLSPFAKPTESENKLKLFDQERFLKSMSYDIDFAQHILTQYLHDSAGIVQSMKESIKSNTHDNLQTQAHSLKISSNLITAYFVEKQALQIENNYKDCTIDMISDLEKELESVIQIIMKVDLNAKQ